MTETELNDATAEIKLSLRISTNAFDSQIQRLINMCLADLGIAGVEGDNVVITNDLIYGAVESFVAMRFGEPDEYERHKKSYDEQKAQLSMSAGYTDYSMLDDEESE